MHGGIASALLLLVSTACSGADAREGRSAGDLDCMEGDIAISEAIHTRWIDPNACTAHSDCLHVSTHVQCPDDGATRYGCPRAIHRDSAGAFAALLDDVKSDLCPRIDPDCFGGAGCASTTPRCVDGVCMGLLEGEFDAGPPTTETSPGG